MKLTEAKLKQLINEVLEEGMKTIADLPEGIFIKVVHATTKTIEVYFADKTGFMLKYENESKPYGTIAMDVETQLADDFPCLDAMMVAYSDAVSGWGPLLYDVSIEVATIMASGLVSDRTIVSRSAYKVWDFYQNRRGDVEKIQLDDDDGTLTPDIKEDDCLQYIAQLYSKRTDLPWHETPLSKLYRKEPTTLRDLENGGRLINDLKLNF